MELKIAFLIIVASVSNALATPGYSQMAKVSLDMENKSLEQVMDKIEQQSEFYFIFNQKQIDVNRVVDIKAENELITDILPELFKGTNVNYAVFDRKILLTTDPIENNLLAIASGTEPQKQITGTVTDKNGPLPGVNVVVTGTTQGTITDIAGKYSIDVPQGAKSLTFSFIGMEPQKISIGTLTQINVTLAESAIGLEEVVVIGYGTQKRINLTGSVSSIESDQLNKKIVSQASQLLQGEVSGITVTQTSGQPGSDGASLKIRGLGTFSGAGVNPLVIIDGVPGSINSVNPDNIESISVLKDAASCAIYGARAANGVILITTKEGKEGIMQVSYESYIGKQEATELPQYVDSWTYAEMENESRANMNQQLSYTQEQIDKFKSGVDPDNYPNKHHLKDLFNSGNGLQTKHNLTFNGGTEKALYLFSAGYLKQNGLIMKNNYDRYDMQLNVSSKLRDNLKLNVKLSGYQSLNERPAGITSIGTGALDMGGSVIEMATHSNATVPGKKSDGTYGLYLGHPVAQASLDSKSFGETISTSFNNIASLEWDIIKSLKLSSKIGYLFGHSKNRLFGAQMEANPDWIFGPSNATATSSFSTNLLFESLINYDKTFGDHYLHILGGFSNETSKYEYIQGYRNNFSSNLLYVLNAASSKNQANSENATVLKIMSYFGRLNYSFQEKYFLEGNFRCDGSSRFSKGNRFGLFPSVSAGWIISKEDFFQIPSIELLKIRGSYGVLGNEQIGTYPYQKVLNLGVNYVTGEPKSLNPAIELSRLPFSDITWETTKITDAGIDINLFKGKLNFIIDYYYKLTNNILYSLSVSNVLGMSGGEQNAGKVENKGWEFELVHKNKIGEFSYSINTNFSVNHNQVLYLVGVEKDINKGLFVGHSLGSIYGYETDGLFVDKKDIENYATQNYPAKPGFPRFKDISGPDGVPDGKVSAEYDRTIIANTFPKYSYGMGIMADYKGFDFYMQLQGQGGYQKMIQSTELAFYNAGNVQKWQVDNRWTVENPDPDAKYPRMETAYHIAPWDANLDYWVQDASFIRIKNVQLGYNVPSELLNNTFIHGFRVYLHGENIICFDHYRPGWDPEMSSGGGYSYYPISRIWSLGVSVQF